MTMDQLKAKIRSVPDFPKAGILFYDITTLLQDPVGFRAAVDTLCAPFVNEGIDLVVGIEGRTWLNDDGHLNFPGGEVFTGPVESATEAVIPANIQVATSSTARLSAASDRCCRRPIQASGFSRPSAAAPISSAVTITL